MCGELLGGEEAIACKGAQERDLAVVEAVAGWIVFALGSVPARRVKASERTHAHITYYTRVCRWDCFGWGDPAMHSCSSPHRCRPHDAKLRFAARCIGRWRRIGVVERLAPFRVRAFRASELRCKARSDFGVDFVDRADVGTAGKRGRAVAGQQQLLEFCRAEGGLARRPCVRGRDGRPGLSRSTRVWAGS